MFKYFPSSIIKQLMAHLSLYSPILFLLVKVIAETQTLSSSIFPLSGKKIFLSSKSQVQIHDTDSECAVPQAINTARHQIPAFYQLELHLQDTT